MLFSLARIYCRPSSYTSCSFLQSQLILCLLMEYLFVPFSTLVWPYLTSIFHRLTLLYDRHSLPYGSKTDYGIYGEDETCRFLLKVIPFTEFHFINTFHVLISPSLSCNFMLTSDNRPADKHRRFSRQVG